MIHTIFEQGELFLYARKPVFTTDRRAGFAGGQPSRITGAVLRGFAVKACRDVDFTFGLYELYWFYKNWQYLKLREKENISPFWRAFFGIFFCYSLFSEIREWQKELGKGQMPAGWLTFGWIVTTMAYRLPDPLWLVSMASVAFLVPVQKVANDINREEAPEHDPNNKIQGANWVGIVLGGLVFALALFGTFAPDNPA